MKNITHKEVFNEILKYINVNISFSESKSKHSIIKMNVGGYLRKFVIYDEGIDVEHRNIIDDMPQYKVKVIFAIYYHKEYWQETIFYITDISQISKMNMVIRDIVFNYYRMLERS